MKIGSFSQTISRFIYPFLPHGQKKLCTNKCCTKCTQVAVMALSRNVTTYPKKSTCLSCKKTTFSGTYTMYAQDIVSSRSISYSETDLQRIRSNSRTITRIPSSDGRDLVAFLQGNQTIEIWDCNIKKMQQTLQNYISINCFAYCAELSNNQGSILAVGTAGGLLQLWNASIGKIIGEYPIGYDEMSEQATPITDVVNVTNGKLAIGMQTSSLSIWDFNQKAEVALIQTNDNGSPICCINYLRDNLIACGLQNGVFQVWDWDKQKLIFSSVIYEGIPASCFCMPSENILLVGTTLGDIRFFDFANKLPDPYLTVYTGIPLSMCLMDDEHVLFGNGSGSNILNVTNGFYRFIQGNYNFYGTYGLCAPDATGSFVTGASNYNSGDTLNNLIKYIPENSKLKKTEKRILNIHLKLHKSQ